MSGKKQQQQKKTQQSLKTKSKLKPFKQIEKSVKRSKLDSKKHEKTTSCVCVYDPEYDACGDDCLNRNMDMECSPKSCPCKENCTNMPIGQKRFVIIIMVYTYILLELYTPYHLYMIYRYACHTYTHFTIVYICQTHSIWC